MGGLCLHCDLCGGEFSSKPEWNKHLVEDKHQSVSRTKWMNFLTDEFSRTTSALVFTSFSISRQSGLDVISKFSQRILDYVVHFVWWEERPFLGVLQFESRRKLEQVLKRLENGTDATVNGNPVQLQKASEILQLEWRCLLPGESEELITPVPGLGGTNTSSEIPPSSNLIIHPSSLIPSPKTPLQKDWNSICSSIELTDSKCSTVLQIISDLTELFRRHHHPECAVFLFRNFFLRLQSVTEVDDIVLLFVYIPPPPSASTDDMAAINMAIEEKVFQSDEFAQLFPGHKRTSCSPFQFIRSPGFIHDSSQFMFNITSNPPMVVFVYLARLALYLALFDSRVKGVLTLVRFWARAHKIRIAQSKPYANHRYAQVPDPFPLDWLVILFLIKEKVVPSVREITDRPHPPFMICNNRGNGYEIGFPTDLEFVQAWTRDRKVPKPGTDDFITSVVTLTRDIFKFYSSTLKEGCWVVNPKDGELIKREGPRCRKSSLSIKEIERLTDQVEHKKTRNNIKITCSRICVLNPLVITWRLSFCEKRWRKSTCHQMEAVANRLTTLLEEGGILQEALVGGVHDAEEVQLDPQRNKSQRLMRTPIVTKRTSQWSRYGGKKRRKQ